MGRWGPIYEGARGMTYERIPKEKRYTWRFSIWCRKISGKKVRSLTPIPNELHQTIYGLEGKSLLVTNGEDLRRERLDRSQGTFLIKIMRKREELPFVF